MSVDIVLQRARRLYKNGKHLETIDLLKDAIRNKNDDVKIRSALGLAFYELNKKQDSLHYFNYALEIDRNYLPALQYKAMILMESDNYEEALKVLIVCKEKYPEVHAPQNNLALCYQELSKVNKANEIFENLLNQFPQEHISYVNYAMFLSEIGNIKKAKEIHFDALKKFKNTLAFQQLCEMGEIQKGNKIISIMENALVSEEMNITDKINICFGLGAYYSFQKDYINSSKFYIKGNKLRRSTISFDHSFFEKKINYKNRYENIYNKIQIDNSKFKNIFIVGLPRSGTSLLEQMLDRHDDIIGLGETGIIQNQSINFFKNKSSVFSITDKDIEMDVRKEMEAISRDVITAYKTKSSDKSFDGYYVDKNPLNFIDIGFINSLISSSKFINIMRNSDDNLPSIYFSNFSGAHNYAYTPEEIKLFNDFYIKIMEFWKEKLHHKIIDIKYEDLIRNPENEITRILKFLNLKYDENCLLPHENKRSVRTRSKFQIREKINKKGVHKYSNYKKFIPDLFN